MPRPPGACEASTIPVWSRTRSLILSARFERNTKTAPQNGSSPNISCTPAPAVDPLAEVHRRVRHVDLHRPRPDRASRRRPPAPPGSPASAEPQSYLSQRGSRHRRQRSPGRGDLRRCRHLRPGALATHSANIGRATTTLGHNKLTRPQLLPPVIDLPARRPVPPRGHPSPKPPGTRLSAAIRARSTFVRRRRPVGPSITSRRETSPPEDRPNGRPLCRLVPTQHPPTLMRPENGPLRSEAAGGDQRRAYTSLRHAGLMLDGPGNLYETWLRKAEREGFLPTHGSGHLSTMPY